MIFSLVFAIILLILSFLNSLMKVLEYVEILATIPWDTIITISTISLVNEYRKYICDYDLLSFLGFEIKFSSIFKRLTNFISFLFLLISLLNLFLIYTRDFLFFVEQTT